MAARFLMTPTCSAAVLAMLLLPLSSARGADPDRGLWVGQITLNYVNEVSVPLDENNVPIAPDPKTPTPTADQAHLRLILHVNGAGQTSLLKEVAVLNRVGSSIAGGVGTVDLKTNSSLLKASGTLVQSDSDVALVTDPRLYAEFPPQAAIRIAAASFDFGDSRATDALNEIASRAAIAAGNSVAGTTRNLADTTDRIAAENAAEAAALIPAQDVVTHADVAESFSQFLRTNLTPSAITLIAAAANPAQQAASHRLQAEALRDRSFYKDARAVAMIDAVVAVVSNTPSASKNAAAHNWASAYADATDDYDRYIAGKLFGDMIAAGAFAAAGAATNFGITSPTNGAAATAFIRAQVNASETVRAAQTEAQRIKVRTPPYLDTRSSSAVELVLDAIVAQSVTCLTNPPTPPKTWDEIRVDADRAGRTALADRVTRYAASTQVPTLDYSWFVQTNLLFLNSPAVAAEAAAAAAVAERKDNLLYTLNSLTNVAKAAAINALRDAYLAAARALRTELPLDGDFGAGKGDPRLTWDIKRTNGVPLQPAGMRGALTGTIVLPASHPTNPFRHRRHPDHEVGFDITRLIELDFDSLPVAPQTRAGYGVDRLTGTYREEIDGLHKPLGPEKNIGLKVEGRFELNRISLIDTLNAR